VLETGQLRYHRWDEHTQAYFERGWVHTWAPPLLQRNAVAEVELYRSDAEGAEGRLEGTGRTAHGITRAILEPRWSWAYKREAAHFVSALTGAPALALPGSEDAPSRTEVSRGDPPHLAADVTRGSAARSSRSRPHERRTTARPSATVATEKTMYPGQPVDAERSSATENSTSHIDAISVSGKNTTLMIVRVLEQHVHAVVDQVAARVEHARENGREDLPWRLHWSLSMMISSRNSNPPRRSESLGEVPKPPRGPAVRPSMALM
jgi:hypothetical protein